METRRLTTRGQSGWRSLWQLSMIVLVPLLGGGCMRGPNYVRPQARVADQWLEAGDARVKTGPQDYSQVVEHLS